MCSHHSAHNSISSFLPFLLFDSIHSLSRLPSFHLHTTHTAAHEKRELEKSERQREREKEYLAQQREVAVRSNMAMGRSAMCGVRCIVRGWKSEKSWREEKSILRFKLPSIASAPTRFPAQLAFASTLPPLVRTHEKSVCGGLLLEPTNGGETRDRRRETRGSTERRKKCFLKANNSTNGNGSQKLHTGKKMNERGKKLLHYMIKLQTHTHSLPLAIHHMHEKLSESQEQRRESFYL
jgi:hypothetical protein